MRNITIKVIPDSKQRYETSGDYWIDKRGTIQVRISKSENWRYEALLLIHELTEMFLCIDRGVSFKAIDRFDMTFKGDKASVDHLLPRGTGVATGDAITAKSRARDMPGAAARDFTGQRSRDSDPDPWSRPGKGVIESLDDLESDSNAAALRVRRQSAHPGALSSCLARITHPRGCVRTACSGRRHSSVDRQRGAGDEGRLVGQKEERRIRDLLGPTGAAHRH